MNIKFIVKNKKCMFCEKWIGGVLYKDYNSKNGALVCNECFSKYGHIQEGVCSGYKGNKCGNISARGGWSGKINDFKWECFDCYKISVGGSSGGGGGMRHNTFGLK